MLELLAIHVMPFRFSGGQGVVEVPLGQGVVGAAEAKVSIDEAFRIQYAPADCAQCFRRIFQTGSRCNQSAKMVVAQ